MRKSAIILAVIAISAVLLSSCGKYEEGPAFSLATKKARLKGTWKVSEIKMNDEVIDLSNVDITEITGNNSTVSISLKLKFDKDGDGKAMIAISSPAYPFALPFERNLNWEFSNSKENLRIKIEQRVPDVIDIPERLIEDIPELFSPDWVEFEIIRLTRKELWLRSTETGNGIETKTEMKLDKEK